MDTSGSRGPPPPPRSRTSSTSSLRSPSGAGHQQAPATPPRGTGTSPATSAGMAYAGSHTPSRQLSTGSLVGVPFQGVSPDQLMGAVGGAGRMRCPSIASIDQLSSSSRSSSIPPTPAPTPNPLLQVRYLITVHLWLNTFELVPISGTIYKTEIKTFLFYLVITWCMNNL